MRFMMIVKASGESEAGVMPKESLLDAMTKYNEQLADAGVLVDLSGLQPTSKGARIRFSASGTTVIRGPFGNPADLIAGYWIINVKSFEEAIDWARRAPNPHVEGQESEIEVRQFFELDDFAPSAAVERARELESKLGRD